MALKQILLEQIAEHGPMPFEEFQRAALYHSEHGFFSKGELRSTKAGDFLTSPEVSSLFGETLAVFVEQEHHRVCPPEGGKGPAAEQRVGGSPRPPDELFSEGGKGPAAEQRVGGHFHLIEVGAGSGSLLRPLLNSLSFVPTTWAIEASPMAREALQTGTVPLEGGRDRSGGAAGVGVGAVASAGARGFQPEVSVLSSLDDLPDTQTGVILANELIDNLPVAIAVRTETGWRERWVGADGRQFSLVDAPARREVVEWCDRFAGPCPIDGYVEVQLAAAEWLRTALLKLDRGAVLLVDYGDTAENLEPRRTEGTLRTYRAHHLGPHPLDEPGETDITVDVNFTALHAVAEQMGAIVEYHRQDDFLASLGLRERLSQLRRDELALARDGDPMERLRIRSLKNEVETLLHPRGLGDFRVLVARVG